MNKKEKLRQQLLEQTFGKNAKNRRINSFNISSDFNETSHDLEDIAKYQQSQIEELSQSLSHEEIDKLNQEMEKDFGVKIISSQKIDDELLNKVETSLIQTWHYDEMIHEFIMTMKKIMIMNKKESSFLFYNIEGKDIKNIFNDYANRVYQQDITYLSILNYTQHIDIFYQDIYRCLYSNQKIIVIDYLEHLPITFIQPLLSLLKNIYGS